MKEKVNLGKRPKCKCGKDCQFMGKYRVDGSAIFRKVCAMCHQKAIAKKRGAKSFQHVLANNAGFKKPSEHLNHKARQKGYSSYSQLLNEYHPYRKYRKEYCENKDGRLGFVCRVKIRIPAQLQVDHKNGNPSDNRPRNLQTLCACCHIFKTHKNRDYETAGRKKLGVRC